MPGRKHLIAVNRSIKAAGLDDKGIDAALVELLRDLARRMDNAGADGPPLNLYRSYLSATKDLARAGSRKPAPKPREEAANESAAQGAPALTIVEETPLEKLRRKKRRSA